MKQYIYPAIITVAEDGYSVEFPDLQGCLSCGDSIEEIFYMATDVLTGVVQYMIEDGEELPTPTSPEQIKLEQGQFTTLVKTLPYKLSALNYKPEPQ